MSPCAVITGAGSGIGKEIAHAYAKEGYELCLLGRDVHKLSQTGNELSTPYHSFPIDLNQLDQVEQVGNELTDYLKNKKLKALIHNAGLIHRTPFQKTTRDQWQESFHVHLLGPLLLTQKLIPLLALSAPASIVHISSTLGIKPIKDTSSYSAIKAALINLTHSLALELSDLGIRVNAVAPGIVETPIHGQWTDEMRTQMNHLQPLKRIGTPQEIARSVFFLGSEQSSWTTGSILTVDGGITLV